MLVRSTKRSRNRRALDPAMLPIGPVINATLTLVAGKVQIDFDQAVSVSDLPGGITVQGAGPINYTVNTQTRITLIYSPPAVVGNACVIPSNLPQIRNRNGGYVVGQSKTF